MKKLTLLFAVACMFMATISAQTSGTCGANLTWTLTGTGAMTNYVSPYSTPWYSQQQTTKTVVIGNNVTSIGNYAFGDCIGLTSVTIPDLVTTIGSGAFRRCSALTSVTIPNSVTTIGIVAFSECIGLTPVTIPNSVTTIKESTFYGCSSLSSVTIPNSVTTIEESAFYGCSGLTNIINNSPNFKFASAASVGTALVLLPVSHTSDDFDYATDSPAGCLETGILTIPNSVTTIGSSAFSACSGFTSITIPNSVTSIGSGAFSGCSGLTSITIPTSITSIGNNVFFGCSGLTSITIPTSITSIGNSAFSGCSGLSSVTIPNAVTTIGNYAFGNCTGLTSITIPTSITSIGNSAFSGCSGLSSVTIPNAVTTIGNYAFGNCTGLTTVNFNAINCTTTGETAIFNNCLNVTAFNIGSTVTKIPSDICSGLTGLTSITIPNLVTSIGSYAFAGCTGLTSITIPNSVTSIGSYAFSSCPLSNIIVSSGNTSYKLANNVGSGKMVIPYTANGFNGSNMVGKLVCGDITISSSVTSIGGSAFWGCAGLTAVNIPNSVTSIGSSAFSYCRGLTDVTVNWAEPLSINSDVFYNDTLSNVNLHVPENSCTLYKAAPVWQDFNFSCGSSQTIDFSAIPEKTYGDENFTLSASASSGLPVTFESNNSTVATVLDNTVTIVGAGEASIIASQAGDEEYAPATVSQTLTVNKAQLTITAENKTRPQGQPNPAFTLSYNGFQYAENQSVLDVLPTISCSASESSPVGFYDIVLSGGSDNNYAYTLVNGQLEVTATYTITAIVIGTGGIITPEGSISVNAGNNKTFVFTPDNNYQIYLVLVDEIPDAQAKADGYYTFTNIADNHTISVLFESYGTGIEDVVVSQLNIFPNPAKDELKITNYGTAK